MYLENPHVLVPVVPGKPLILYLAMLEEPMGCVLGKQDATRKKEQAIYYLCKKFTDFDKRYPALERTCCALPLLHEFLDEHIKIIAEIEPELDEWTMWFDGVSNLLRNEIGVVLPLPKDQCFPFPTRLGFDCTNNMVEYEACTMGIMMALEHQVNEGQEMIIRVQNQTRTEHCQYLGWDEVDMDAKPWYHDIKRNLWHNTNGHALAQKVLRAGFYWTKMESNCCHHVKRCMKCQIYTNNIHEAPSVLHNLMSPWPFSMWSLDVIGSIEPKASNGHRFILMAIDYFTEWIEAASYPSMTRNVVVKFVKKGHHMLIRSPNSHHHKQWYKPKQ
ncbi:hypothetical protein CR513_46681, partial [Mucuna pruriens]